jgi:hypothetical protein
MADIPIGRIGKVVSSPRNLSIGWFITVQPESGGFLILYSEDRNMSGTVYDDFAVDEQELRARLRDWHIEWSPAAEPVTPN